jgi:hypothetical protein
VTAHKSTEQGTDHYLSRCLDQFAEVSKARYGSPFNLAAIERDVQPLQNKRTLTIQDLYYFKNDNRWWFKRYWVLPTADDVEQDLGEARFDFHQLSQGNEGSPTERHTLERLVSIFRSVELVSIILRFIKPDSFGILSPPVERVLDVRRGSSGVDTYLHYLRDLRSIRDHYPGLPRAADADMALWVLHERCFSPDLLDPAIKLEYERDPFMLRLRAANLVTPLSRIPMSRLAQALETTRNDLAGLVACRAFEAAIHDRARREKVPPTKKAKDGRTVPCDLEDFINVLRDRKVIDSLTAATWHRLRRLRNNLVHGEVEALQAAEIRDLVQEVLKIEETNRELEAERSPGRVCE